MEYCPTFREELDQLILMIQSDPEDTTSSAQSHRAEQSEASQDGLLSTAPSATGLRELGNL